MQFDKNIPIYIQIEDFIQDRIINKIWLPLERIPSVRELAETLEVNPNTVMRSYERLEREQIIFNQRGVGFFVSDQAMAKIRSKQSDHFFENLPSLFKTMKTLGIGMEEVHSKWLDFNKNKTN